MTFGVSLLNYRPGHVGGIETYLRKLIEAFSTQDRDHDIRFIAGRDVAAQLPKGTGCQEIPVSAAGLIGWRCAEAFTPFKARKIADAIDRGGYDAVLFPQQSIFPIDVQTPAVLTVGDLQHLHYPEYFCFFDTHFRRGIYPESLRRCVKAIAVSQATKDDLVQTCGMEPDRIEVVHHGFDNKPVPSAFRERVFSSPYLYYPAATFPHKGHARLLECFARLKKEQPGSLKLVFSGMQTRFWNQLRKQVCALGLQDEVLHLGFVPYDQVVSLYQHAEAIVFPTEFEGFGMPVLEAVRYGKPVFCSDLPVFEELGVPAENRLDFRDENALLTVMDALVPTVLSRTPMSWAECAEKTLQVMVGAVS